MWVAELRAITFSDAAVLRATEPDALRQAARAAVETGNVGRPAVDLDAAWSRYEAERREARWQDQRELLIESFFEATQPGRPARPLVDAAAEAFGRHLEWHPDALPALDYLRESGYRTVLLADLPLPLPPVWRERAQPWFEDVVASRELAKRTPDPAAFHESLRRLHLGAPHVLHVGEGLVEDVHAAQATRLRGALLQRFGRGPADPEAAAWLRRERSLDAAAVTPDLKFRTLEELPAALDAFG